MFVAMREMNTTDCNISARFVEFEITCEVNVGKTPRCDNFFWQLYISSRRNALSFHSYLPDALKNRHFFLRNEMKSTYRITRFGNFNFISLKLETRPFTATADLCSDSLLRSRRFKLRLDVDWTVRFGKNVRTTRSS